MSGDIAIAHGHLTSDGGAERVVLDLARTFDAPIYAAKVNHEYVPEDVEAHQVFTSRWARFFNRRTWKPRLTYWLGKHLYTMQRGSWIPELYEYDTIIQNKGALAWFVPQDGQTIVRYLHSTPRRPYDQFHRTGRSITTRLYALWERTMKRQTAAFPDLIVANSDTTAQRARTYWNVRDDRLRVCYPPVPASHYSPQYAPQHEPAYYLSLGRLYNNKHTSEIIEAFQNRHERLLVAGDGPNRSDLEAQADGHDNIHILGYVDEQRKRELLAGARALVMNADHEDFGIAPIEAMASGTPVIGVDEPFTCHQIIDGENGLTYQRGVSHLAAAVESFERNSVAWGDNELESFAAQFSVDRFRTAMREHVRAAQARSEVIPPWKADDDTDTEVEAEAEAGASDTTPPPMEVEHGD